MLLGKAAPQPRSGECGSGRAFELLFVVPFEELPRLVEVQVRAVDGELELACVVRDTVDVLDLVPLRSKLLH